LSIDDFARTSKGQMINPLSFCYLIYSHSSFSDCWELAINQAIQNLPANCSAIYLLSERSDETLLKFEQQSQKSRINLVTYDGTAEYTDRLIEVFSEISTKFSLCYFVHEDMPLYSEINYTYLNTLLHYMNHSQEYYIKLVDTTYVDEKQDHTSFPGLVKNTGGYSISVQPALMKLDFMIPFLSGFRQNIYGFEELCTRANLTFSAVAGTRKVGSYLLANTRFPHIATAISKGKWCTSEWGEELGYLAEKYQIDLSIRGEC
jgi:hypothetical protein